MLSQANFAHVLTHAMISKGSRDSKAAVETLPHCRRKNATPKLRRGSQLDWFAWTTDSAKLYYTFIPNNSIKCVMALFPFFRLHGKRIKGGHTIILKAGDGASVKE